MNELKPKRHVSHISHQLPLHDEGRKSIFIDLMQ